MSYDTCEFERTGKLIYIKKPQFSELDYVSELWSDNETMKDVGGTVSFPEERKREWYSKMVCPSDGKNFYCLIYNKEDNPVGEVSFHRYDEKSKTAQFNIKVQNKYRHRGYGREAIKLMLDYYFYEFGGQVLMDEVINVNGEQALLKFGFEVVSKSKDSVVFKMTRERYTQLLALV